MKYILIVLILTGIVYAGSTRTLEVTQSDPHDIMVECSRGNPVVYITAQERIGETRNVVEIVCK